MTKRFGCGTFAAQSRLLLKGEPGAAANATGRAAQSPIGNILGCHAAQAGTLPRQRGGVNTAFHDFTVSWDTPSLETVTPPGNRKLACNWECVHVSPWSGCAMPASARRGHTPLA